MRQHQRDGVLCKGAGRVAVHIARELVQHNDLRQPSLSRRALGKKLTFSRSLQRGAKACADGVVQRGVFDEVMLGG